MPLETFPSYDFPLWGNTPESTESGGAVTGNIDMPFGENYFGTGDSSGDKEKTYSVIPNPPFNLSTVAADFTGGIGKVLEVPVEGTKTFFGGLWDKATSGIRNTYFYLIGGVALIGIIAIVALGAGTRFMGKMEGK
jgi:hypothetical protein